MIGYIESMAHWPAIFAFLSTAVLAGCSFRGATQSNALRQSVFEAGGAAQLEAIRAGRAGAEAPGIAVARIDESGRIDILAVGCARFARDGRSCLVPFTPDSVLRVASISKVVTALAAMQLVSRGQLSLDRDVSDYLGFVLRNPAFPETAITLRTLLSHTSSLRDAETYWAPHPQTLADLVSGTQYFDAAVAPGQRFQYSNLGYGIVGAIVECVAAERFDRYMHRTLFAPRTLQAGYNWSGLETLGPASVATLYRKGDDAGHWNARGPWIPQVDDFDGGAPRTLVRSGSGLSPPPTDYRLCSNGTLFAPHGGLRISTRDLARLVRGALEDSTLEPLAQAEWHATAARDNGDTQGDLYLGFGLGLQTDIFGSRLTGHFGDAYGLKAGVLLDLDNRRAWIYLITGTSRPPQAAEPPFAGVDTLEAATLQALGVPLTR